MVPRIRAKVNIISKEFIPQAPHILCVVVRLNTKIVLARLLLLLLTVELSYCFGFILNCLACTCADAWRYCFLGFILLVVSFTIFLLPAKET